MTDITENEIAAVSSAPRITPMMIDENIVSEHYFTAADGWRYVNYFDTEKVKATPAALDLLTICVLVLRNGFTVTGESACASPENFNAEIGQRIAREDAVNKMWPLMGYALKDRLTLAVREG